MSHKRLHTLLVMGILKVCGCYLNPITVLFDMIFDLPQLYLGCLQLQRQNPSSPQSLLQDRADLVAGKNNGLLGATQEGPVSSNRMI